MMNLIEIREWVEQNVPEFKKTSNYRMYVVEFGENRSFSKMSVNF